MSTFIIKGQNTVAGTVRPSGNKNEALPAVAAALLANTPVTLHRMPQIKDVLTMCDILSELNVEFTWLTDDCLKIDPTRISYKPLNPALCEKIRASILLLGPMLSRFGSVEMPLPGGDIIGARRMDTHFEGIEALGGSINLKQKIVATAKHIVGCDVYLDEPSVTATENLVMLAALAKGRTILHHAACEPHVVGLCRMLNKMGAKISGLGSNRIEIEGVDSLDGCEHTIGPDFMEVGSFLCLGAIGGGKVIIDDVCIEDLRFSLKTFKKIGIEPEIKPNQLIIDGSKELKMLPDISGRIGSIYSGPWPAFPTDLMSVAIIAATQARGTVIFHEKMFEGRMFFTDKLMSMGANIVLCDPHRIVVTGPTPLTAAYLSSPDVRAGMTMIMAAIIAKGTSVISNIHQVERGYYKIEKKTGRFRS